MPAEERCLLELGLEQGSLLLELLVLNFRLLLGQRLVLLELPVLGRLLLPTLLGSVPEVAEELQAEASAHQTRWRQ